MFQSVSSDMSVTQGQALDWPRRILLAAAFATGFSLPLGRALLAATLVLLLYGGIRARRAPLRMPTVAWLGLLLFLLATVVTVWGVNPGHGVPRLTKLLWYIGIPVTATLAGDAGFRHRLIRCLVWGTAVTGLRVACWNPLMAWRAVAGGEASAGFTRALIDTGSLTHAQLLMVGFVASVLLAVRSQAGVHTADLPPGTETSAAPDGVRPAISGAVNQTPSRPGKTVLHDSGGKHAVASVMHSRFLLCWLPVVLTGTGLVMALKRGPWLSAGLVLGVALAPRLGWRRMLGLLLLLAGIVLALPAVRERLADIPNEFSRERGGRVVMWTDVAGGLLREHPWGVGFRSLTNDLMRQHAPQVEHNRNHLHSNIVETLVALGPLGLALYLAWMGVALRDAFRMRRRAQACGVSRSADAVLPAMLGALLLTGMVEYNFADAGIVLVYGLVMGLAAAVAERRL